MGGFGKGFGRFLQVKKMGVYISCKATLSLPMSPGYPQPPIKTFGEILHPTIYFLTKPLPLKFLYFFYLNFL